MRKELIRPIMCMFLFGMVIALFVMNLLDLYLEVLIGTAILLTTLIFAGSILWGKSGNAALARRPQFEPAILEEEEDDDEELKEDILRILFPGIPVDEESNVLKDLMEGREQEEEDADDGFTCAICLDPIVPGDLVVSGASCSHVFHRPCVFQWLMKKRRRRASDEQKHNGCPTCRRPMWTDEEYEKAEAAATAARNKQNKDEQQEIVDLQQQQSTSNEQSDQLQQQTTNEGAVAQSVAAAGLSPPISAPSTEATTTAATATSYTTTRL